MTDVRSVEKIPKENGMTTYRPVSSGAAVHDPGVEGNNRLTSVTGLLLIVMLAIEGLTILSIRGLISWHIFVGIALVGPVLLKSASTIYRFWRYYSGSEAYVRKGPPHMILRLIGPLVILTSLLVIGTGIGLLAYHPGEGGLLLLAHKASFIVWVALMTVHVLGHLQEALTASWQEVRPAPGDRAARHRFTRGGAVVVALVLGVGAASIVTPHATAWTSHQFRSQHDH